MVDCPVCGRALPEAEAGSLCKCGAHLGLLKQLVDRANSLLNQAISAAQTGDFETALRLLDMRAEMVTEEVDVSILRVKLLVHLKGWAAASDILAGLQAAVPGHPVVAQLVQGLVEQTTLHIRGE